jgi:glycosyltransferase involved in cell wall biosynthesis
MGRGTVSTLPAEFPWVKVLRTPLMDRLHPVWFVRQVTIRFFTNDCLLSWFLSRNRIDLLSHSTYLGSGSSIKTLPWLYDFQFMHLPEYWTPKQIRWSEIRYKNACKFGDGIIVSSNDACLDLKSFAPWCEKPKYVLQFVSNPVDFERLPDESDLRARYSLPNAYFHLSNQFWSNKNHRLVIDALALLKKEGVDTVVACTGKPFDTRMPRYFDELMAYCEEKGVKESFRVLGIVPHADLQGLMAYSTAVINPSRFEGWNTSVEEAKTMHKRLLLSDIPVHREQAPGNARFFNFNDYKALANCMTQVLEEDHIDFSQEDVSEDYQRRLQAYGRRYLDIVTNLFQSS